MKKISVVLANIIIILLFLFSFELPCYANSAEPPSIMIIVPNAPGDLEISMKFGDSIFKARKTDKVIEKHYTFYSSEMRKTNNYILIVSTNSESFEINLNKPIEKYNNIYTLNLVTHSISDGKLFLRSVILVSTRLILTLAIEAIIFWMFGFRDRKSWAAFFIINLITQGTLNIWINSFTPRESYIIFSLIFGEIFVFIAEIIAFSKYCKEYTRLRKVLYVLTANFISLIAGGYIITILPI